jgi:F-type H+-transporting ATPase subunit delta
MPSEKLARRYATAVFQLAQDAGSVKKIQSDLHTVADSIKEDDRVRRFFRSPVVDRKEKDAIFAQAFAGLDPIVLHTVLLLIRKRREAIVDELVAQYDILERDSRHAQPLQITTARPLADTEINAIVARLSQAFHATFDVVQSVDPSLIGGVRITMGDTMADGTVSGRLDDIARLLSTN